MGTLSSRIDAAKLQLNKLSPYDSALEEAALLSREFIALSAKTLPGSTGDGKFSLVLPDLPAGAAWKLAAVGDAQAKLLDCGSAGSTVVQIRVGTTNMATITIGNADTNDTLKNADSVNGGDIPGRSLVEIDVDSIATGAVGPLTIRAKFTIVTTKDAWV
jgi:hypothetical protein